MQQNGDGQAGAGVDCVAVNKGRWPENGAARPFKPGDKVQPVNCIIGDYSAKPSLPRAP